MKSAIIFTHPPDVYVHEKHDERCNGKLRLHSHSSAIRVTLETGTSETSARTTCFAEYFCTECTRQEKIFFAASLIADVKVKLQK